MLAGTAAWTAGWHYLRAGFFWEAHEVLEPVWMATRPDSPERQLVQGVIQIANAALKIEMQRPNAVRRLCDIADAHIAAAASAGTDPMMGLHFDALHQKIDEIRKMMK